MKKLIAILLACTALTCSFAGCGNKDSSDNSGSSTVEEAKSPVVGKWKLTGKSLDDLKAVCEEKDWKLKEAIVELDDSGNMTSTIRLYPYDDLYITEDSLHMGGNVMPISFEGKNVVYEENGTKYTVFEKIDPVDENDRNGRYKNLMDSTLKRAGVPEGYECVVEFISKDEGYICYVKEEKYEYNEDEKKLIVDNDETDPSVVEVNGNTMTNTDDDGTVEEYERIN